MSSWEGLYLVSPTPPPAPDNPAFTPCILGLPQTLRRMSCYRAGCTAQRLAAKKLQDQAGPI